MAGSTFQPPIHLDTTQGAPQQTAFINQNFQTIASTLETNSFRIVDRGTVGVAGNASTTTWSTIPHNLGFVPVPFVFLNDITRTIGSTVVTTDANIPFPTWTSLTPDNVNHVINFGTYLDCVVDETNLYIFIFNSTSSTVGPLQISYYLCQQPTN